MQLEEPEDDNEEFDDEEVVELKTSVRVSMLNEISSIVNAIKKLAETCKYKFNSLPIQ